MFELLIATASSLKTAAVTALRAINRELPRLHWLIVAAFAAVFLCVV